MLTTEPSRLWKGAGLSLLILVGSRVSRADDEALATDRPDFTESTASVDPGRVQLETGYTLEDSGQVEIESLGEVLIRVGWTEAVELRLGINSWVTVDKPAGTTSGLEDAAVGIKVELAEGADELNFLAPEVALLVGTTLPTGSSDIGATHLQPNLILALAWTISDRLGIGSNLGATWVSGEDDQYVEGVATIAIGVAFTHRWGSFVEYYAILPQSSGGSSSHFADVGLTYLISNDFQLDLRAGARLDGRETDTFVGTGLAYRW